MVGWGIGVASFDSVVCKQRVDVIGREAAWRNW